MQSPTITQNEYDQRKQFLDDLKLLMKDEYEEIYRILKRNNVDCSENSNGIFFDLNQLSSSTFDQIEKFMDLCKSQRLEQSERAKEMEHLRDETTKTT
jgi:hypothetical protein